MKEKLQLTKSIISVTIVAILLMFTLFIRFGSFAWFSNSSSVSAKGISITAKQDDVIDSVRFFRVSGHSIDDTTKNHIYEFGYNEDVLKDQFLSDGETQERTSFETPISMRPYSQLSSDCQILIEVTLKSSGNANILINTPTTDFLGNIINEKITGKLYDLVPNELPLTSILRFAIFSSLTVKENAFIVDDSVASANQKSFINFNETTKTYSFNQSLKTTPISITPTNNKFYIFLDYNVSLVQYINERIIYYVEEAETASNGGYDAIILGETNLIFKTDFNFQVDQGDA